MQRAHLDENSIDLVTDSWKIRNFFAALGKKYINMGVDGFRIQFARNTDRRDLIYMVENVAARSKPDLIVFADVEPVFDGFGRLIAGGKTFLNSVRGGIPATKTIRWTPGFRIQGLP